MRSFISPTSGERRWKDLGGRLVCLGIAAFFFFGVGKTFYENYKAKYWVEIPATVLSSESEFHRVRKGGSYYEVIIKYEYQFQNELYPGTYHSSHTRFVDREFVEKELARYPIGSPIIAKVNPKNPSRSIVPEKIPLVDYIFFGPIGLFFLWIATLRKKKKKKPPIVTASSLEVPKGTLPPPILK